MLRYMHQTNFQYVHKSLGTVNRQEEVLTYSICGENRDDPDYKDRVEVIARALRQRNARNSR